RPRLLLPYIKAAFLQVITQIYTRERSFDAYRERERQDADLREDADGEVDHAGGGEQRHHRQRQGQDPGQGRYPSGPAAPHLRGEAAGGWPHPGRLQHPEGVDAAPGAPPPRRQQGRLHHPGAQPPAPGAQVQREEDGLPQVLRTPSRQVYQLPQEEVWPHQPGEVVLLLSFVVKEMF
ncbi:Os09g0483200, partial [Oryza sativa Japonica Group]